MNRKRMRKYIAVILSVSMVLGTLLLPNGTIAQAADRESVKSTEKETIFEQGIGDYGYQSLSEMQQTLYDRISRDLETFENNTTEGGYIQYIMGDGTKVYVPFLTQYNDLDLNMEDASQVWMAFGADHPGLFWLENECDISSTHLAPLVRESYWGDDASAKQKREDMKEKIADEVKKYLDVAGYYSLTYDKVREMDERIISNVDFAYQPDGSTSEVADWAYTIEGVFDGEHHAVVSEGYAKAFSFLLNILDIPNVYVTGKVTKNGQVEPHAWNCVSFDNGETYYYMDLTWDDMGANDSRTGNSYLYFAMPKSKFEQKHHANTPDNNAKDWLYDLPKLGDDMDYTYFKQYGAYGITSEVPSYDAVRGFLSRVKALAPNRLNTYTMIIDAVTLSNIMYVMDLSNMKCINAEEYDLKIWANPLTEYSKGQPNPLVTLETKSLTIDLGSGTEKTLSIASVTGANGNYVRWHSDNNQVAVVKAPAYTKMEEGASVQIVAKKAGTATIRAEGSNAGTMTCTVTVTEERPVVTQTPKPTINPTSKPTINPTSKPTINPTSKPTVNPTSKPTVNPTSKPTVNPTPSTSPSASEQPGTSASPSPSEQPGTSASPSPSEQPETSASPSPSEQPGTSASPAPSEQPGMSASPAPSEQPGTSASPSESEKPGTSTSPTESEKPGTSGSPGITGKPGPGMTVSPLVTKAPAKGNKVKVGDRYRNKKTKGIYRVTATGKTRTVAYRKSTSKNAKKVTIPSSITIQGKKYRVTSIENQAFAGNKKLTEISMGKNIKSIGKKAFYGCKKLKKVELGKNVTVIKESSFRNCTSLTLIIIPKKVKKIGDHAFRDCENLRYIGVKTNRLQLGNVGKNVFAGGYRNPRVKTAKKVWRKYADIFVLRGLSERGIFVINPVKLVI